MTWKPVRIVLAAVLAAVAAACIPLADKPFITPERPGDIGALTGTWKGTIFESPGVAHFFGDGSVADGDFSVLIVGREEDTPDENAGWGFVELTAAKVGTTHFITGRATCSEDGCGPDQVEGYYLMRYAFEGDVLVIEGQNEDVIADAVESGALPGTVTRGRLGDTIEITADGDAYSAYLRGADLDALFTEEVARLSPAPEL